ncbi:MAG: hypothetical protein OCD02_22265 [Spirochaetaceae bacterium]
MFSLYIIIEHNNLLIKSNSINEQNLTKSLISNINNRGGVNSEISSYLSYFPSEYDYSRVNFIKCLQEIYQTLIENSDLVGFSMVIDCNKISSDFEYLDNRNNFILKTNDIDQIWFSNDAYKLLELFFNGKRINGLIKASKDFHKMYLPTESADNVMISESMQNYFSELTTSINFFNNRMSSALYKNINYWANSNKLDKNLFIDFEMSHDHLITFIEYLITLTSMFNPLTDLDSEEQNSWGIYLELFNEFSTKSFNYFVLDDANIHFKKLILLWFESLSLRKSILITISVDDDQEILEILTCLSLLDHINIFVFKNSSEYGLNSITLPYLISLENSLQCTLSTYLKSKPDSSLNVLYIIIITGGELLLSDILNIFKILNYDVLELQEEIDNFIREGLLLGDQNLYSSSKKILSNIIDQKPDLIEGWKNDFIGVFIKEHYNNIFNYAFIFSSISLGSMYHKESLQTLYNCIQNMLDLGREISLPDYYYQMKADIPLQNILVYKKIRENRLNHNLLDIEIIEKLHTSFGTPLEFLDLLNIWSFNKDEKLIDRCKSLYFTYQSAGESFNECRIKMLFSLGLLSCGRVSESIDYFELNCSYSKGISDTYSYIRNGSFLAMAHYVKGDLSGVLRVSELFLQHNWIYFKTRWFLYLKFIRARALSELGMYDDALILLSDGIHIAEEFDYIDILKVFINWKGRTLFFSGNSEAASELLLNNTPNNESFYFLSEIEYFLGNLSKAIEYAEKALFVEDNTVLYDENLKWRDGFFVIEEFYNRADRTSILYQEITYFYYMLKITNGDKDALDKYSEIILNISNFSLAVNDYKYLFYLYIATEDIEITEKINRENIYNKVIRLLQQKTTNLSEHNQKHKFLDNFWNSHINNVSRTKKFFK